ncbi:MAG: ATP-binding protein [Candidatus Micrarchaeia archaeon]|jgi:hypothetical protein
MKVEEFKRILAEWLERPLPVAIERQAIINPNAKTITAIIGPRRVGKTFLMLDCIRRLRIARDEVIFIDFEDNRLAGISPVELDDLFVAWRELTGKEALYVFLDEVQEAPHWEKFVRKLHNTGKCTLVVSGSSSKLLGREIATALRGRYASTLLLPFSFSEFLRLKGFAYNARTVEYSKTRGDMLRLFGKYLETGGFPQIAACEDPAEMKTLARAYFDTTFYRDVVERNAVGRTDVMELLMNHFLDSNAALFSVSSFTRGLAGRGVLTSKKTVSLYFRHLQEAFFVFGVEKFSYSQKVRTANPVKAYLLDNGFQTLLAPSPSPNLGRRLEAAVLHELKRQGFDVFYHKESFECDFVVARGSRPLCVIQVAYKLNETDRKRELSGLAEAMEKLGVPGWVITYDQGGTIEFKGRKVRLIPGHRFLLQGLPELAG